MSNKLIKLSDQFKPENWNKASIPFTPKRSYDPK